MCTLARTVCAQSGRITKKGLHAGPTSMSCQICMARPPCCSRMQQRSTALYRSMFRWISALLAAWSTSCACSDWPQASNTDRRAKHKGWVSAIPAACNFHCQGEPTVHSNDTKKRLDSGTTCGFCAQHYRLMSKHIGVSRESTVWVSSYSSPMDAVGSRNAYAVRFIVVEGPKWCLTSAALCTAVYSDRRSAHCCQEVCVVAVRPVLTCHLQLKEHFQCSVPKLLACKVLHNPNIGVL